MVLRMLSDRAPLRAACHCFFYETQRRYFPTLVITQRALTYNHSPLRLYCSRL
jgi:hypothetical protein